MAERFVWKVEIAFEGTAEEFNHVTAALDQLPVRLSVLEWKDRRHHLAGCMPVPLETIFSNKAMDELAKGNPRLQLKFIRDIYGGIRTPHFHAADSVVLLDRARFKTFVAQVAHELAGRRAESGTDYMDVMDPVNRLGDPTPESA